MVKKRDTNPALDSLDGQMEMIKNFVAELFSKTVFQSGRELGADFTPSQIRTLLTFREDKEYSMSELGENAQIKSSTVTDIIDRLEREEIAERFRDNGDRRMVKVRLTDKGKKIRREFSQKRRKEMETIFSKLNEEDKKALLFHMGEAYYILKKI